MARAAAKSNIIFLRKKRQLREDTPLKNAPGLENHIETDASQEYPPKTKVPVEIAKKW